MSRQSRGIIVTTTKKKRWLKMAILPAAALATAALTAFAGAATQVAPVNTTPPTISGTAKVGQTLTAGDGTWSNTPTSYAYQWLRCNGGGNSCVNVANGTQKTYTLVGVDSGNTMRVRVTATNADGSASAQSDQTAAVEPATSSAAPKNTSAPTISGTPKVGQTLTADNGSWTGSPTTYTYAWQRCDADIASCANVVGATGKTYGVRIDDLGYRLRVSVTAKNAKGTRNGQLGDHRRSSSPPYGSPTAGRRSRSSRSASQARPSTPASGSATTPTRT